MRIKTQPRLVDPSNKINSDLIKELQAIVDDVRGIGAGGLSFDDAQLPFQYREVSVISGQSISMSIQAPYSIIGCIPIQTFGSTISSFQTNIVNNKFNIILNMDISPSKIGFLLIGS